MDREIAAVSIFEDRKALGAFYTDARVADFLVWRAVRRASDTVMGPSSGSGIFLRTERDYFLMLRELCNNRNPGAIVGEEGLDEDDE